MTAINKTGSAAATSTATAVLVGSTTATSAATRLVTPTTTNTPTSGAILKRINYEYPNATGVNPNIASWQCQNVNEPGRGTLRKSFTTANSPVSSGLIVNPATPSNATYGRSACEVLMGHAAKTGNNIYYTLALRFPSTWSGHDTWRTRALVAALDYNNVPASGPITVEAYSRRKGRVALAVASGSCVSGVGCAYDNSCGGECRGHSNNVRCRPSCKIIPARQLTLGVWHQIIIHVYETPYANGLVEAWWRRKGKSGWKKTVRMAGMPTVALGTNSFGHVFTAASYDAGVNVADKFGLQDRDVSRPVSIKQDDDCISTSFKAAVTCLR